MKREPSCCPLRYELPSLKFKTLSAVLYICWVSVVQKIDLEGLAGSRLISLVFLLLIFPTHTNDIYLSISSAFYPSSATKLLPGFNSIMGSSFTSSLVSDGGLQTEVSLKPRL